MKKYRSSPMIYDAVHKVMELSKDLIYRADDIELIKAIYDTPCFQRLKAINQLGLADMVFPTATHSRFSHSVGAAYLASRILNKLKNEKKRNKYIIEKQYYLPIILAALLHDIGHGPFSHNFERFFKYKLGIVITHEDWFDYFLDLIFKFLPSSIAKKTPKNTQDRIKAIFNPKLNPDLLLHKDIIHSQLDCDRLDYLLRDSHFCGVNYGMYDLDYLLHCIVPVENRETYRLGVTAKGVGSVENFLLGRRLMFQNVYHNRTILGFSDNLVLFLLYLSDWIDSSPKSKKEKIQINTLNLFNFLNECNAIQSDGIKKKKEIMKRLLFLYANLTDSDIWHALKNIYMNLGELAPPAQIIYTVRSFIERKGPLVVEISQSDKQIAEKIIQTKFNNQEYLINILSEDFITYYETSHEQEKEELFVKTKTGKKTISEASSIIRLVSDQKERRCYLKIDKRLKNDPELKRIIGTP